MQTKSAAVADFIRIIARANQMIANFQREGHDMRKDHVKYAIASIVIVLGVLTARFGALCWTQRQWFDLQGQQLATIERIGEFPPTGCERATWQNALVTPYNVWGNVTYHPKYSKISNAEMRSLQRKLERIVAETTPENSIESVDDVFQLLLQRGQKTDFISGYRDVFQKFAEQIQRKVGIAEPAVQLDIEGR